MSGLLSRCPPLRAQAAHRAQTRLFARFCVRCLRARVGRLRFVRAGRLLFHGSPVALTLGCAHTLLCGRFVFARVVEEQACCGRVCLRVAGFRVYAGGVFAFWCLRFWCWRFGGVVGQCGPAAPLPRLLACVLTLWCGRCWRVRCSLGCGVTVMGRDNVVPPHTLLVARRWLLRARGRREGLGVRVRVLPRVVNIILLRSPTWERVPPVGAEQGVSGASGRAIVGLGGGGVRVSPFGGGVGLVVTISLGSVRGWGWVWVWVIWGWWCGVVWCVGGGCGVG